MNKLVVKKDAFMVCWEWEAIGNLTLYGRHWWHIVRANRSSRNGLLSSPRAHKEGSMEGSPHTISIVEFVADCMGPRKRAMATSNNRKEEAVVDFDFVVPIGLCVL